MGEVTPRFLRGETGPGLRLQVMWYAQRDSNPCFRRERAAS